MLLLAGVLVKVTRKITYTAIVGARSQDLTNRQQGKGSGT